MGVGTPLKSPHRRVACACAFPGRLEVTPSGGVSHLLAYPGWFEQGYLGQSPTNYPMLLVESNECRFPWVPGRKTGLVHNCGWLLPKGHPGQKISASQRASMPGSSLPPCPELGFSRTSAPWLPRCPLELPVASHWAVGHSCAREGHRLVNWTESKDRQDTNFPRRTPASVMSVPFSTVSGDYGHHPFLLPEDNSSI